MSKLPIFQRAHEINRSQTFSKTQQKNEFFFPCIYQTISFSTRTHKKKNVVQHNRKVFIKNYGKKRNRAFGGKIQIHLLMSLPE